jgi:diguanylate cyclase (GGDEF)-like protein
MQLKSSAISGMAQRVACIALVLGTILLIAALDVFSGVELRVFPLYYLPITFAAWYLGWLGAVAAAALSTFGWYASNQLAGMEFSHAVIWAGKCFSQGLSFATVGLLVTALKSTMARERTLSRMDLLCPLLNRRAFFEESVRLLALCRRSKRPITLAYLDLDNFKAVNDSRGHKAGDDLLCTVARVLTTSIRSSDVAARLGGDEFVILLPEVGPEQAQWVLERLRAAICQSPHPDLPSPVSVSVGAVTYMVAPDDLDMMVQMADSVMYSAKNEGKNRVYLDIIDSGSPPANVRLAALHT